MINDGKVKKSNNNKNKKKSHNVTFNKLLLRVSHKILTTTFIGNIK